jgi:Outer membrane protein beta-barrel domain
MQPKVWFLSFVLALALSAVAMAREEPRLEASGGYSWLSTSLLQDTGFVQAREGVSGWNGSLSWNTTHNLGFVGEFSGFLGTPSLGGTSVKTRYYSFLGGPKITHHNGTDKVEIFVHQLFGTSHATLASGTRSLTTSGFSLVAGVGMDYVIRRHIAIRPFQFDYAISQLAPHSQNQFRFSAGIVVRWAFTERGISCPKCPTDNSSAPGKSQESLRRTE